MPRDIQMIFDQVCSEILSESSEMFVIIQQSIDAVVQQIQETKEYKTVSVKVQYLQRSVELSVQTDSSLCLVLLLQ